MHEDLRSILLQPLIPKLACLLFALVILYQWALFFRAPAEKLPPLNSSNFAEIKKNSTVDKSVKIAIFGQYLPSKFTNEEIKHSLLDLEVVGILYAPSEKESQVIIRAGGGEEKTYQVEERLPGGAVIKRITEKEVIVLHNGSLESLSLPKNELFFQPPDKPLIEE